MADNRAVVMHYMGNALRATYGLEDPTADHGGPMSYVRYLRKMLKKSFWGDEVVLWSISMMWGIKITIVNSKTLQEYRVRHDCGLRDVDVGLVYNGHTTILPQVSKSTRSLVIFSFYSRQSLV